MTRTLALRQAAWAGETSAPEAVPQPVPLEQGDLPTSPLRLGPLRRLPEVMEDSRFPDEIAISGVSIGAYLLIFVSFAFNQGLLVVLSSRCSCRLPLGRCSLSGPGNRR